MNRYVIMARENYPGAQIREICRCSSYPKDIRNALADYTVTGSQGTRIYKYNHVEIMQVSGIKRREPVAQMRKPDRNIKAFAQSEHMVENLLTVFSQIDAMRADNGEQAAQGPAPQTGPAVPQRQPAAEQ